MSRGSLSSQGVGGMSRDYKLRVSSPYFLYLYDKNISVWRPWAPRCVCLAHFAHPIATPEIVNAFVL